MILLLPTNFYLKLYFSHIPKIYLVVQRKLKKLIIISLFIDSNDSLTSDYIMHYTGREPNSGGLGANSLGHNGSVNFDR